MSKENPLWQTDFLILLRWIIFLPIGFILTATLQFIPPMVVDLVKTNLPESTLLTIVGALVAIPILIVLGLAWCMGILMTPRLSCGLIAPNKRIPVVLFGMLFCLFEGTFLVSILAGGTSWIFFVYQLVFSAITVCGIVMFYQEIELSRITRWILRGRTLKQATSRI